MIIRALPLLLALGMAPLVGCGPKEATTTGYINEDGSVNPRAAYTNGVAILKTPDKKTGEVDYAAAYDLFSKSAEAKPDFANAHYNAGWTAEQMGMLSQATSHYREAYNLDPSNTEFLFAYADALNASGDGAMAVELFQKYVDEHPEELEVRSSLMESLANAGRYDDAIAQGRELLILDAKNVSAYRILSRVYFAQGEYAMSQLCAEKAKTLAKGDAGIYNNIGVTYLVMGDQQAAIAEFTTARKLDPDHLEANLNLGYIALDSGDYSLARQCFEMALKSEAGNLDAKLGLAVALRGAKEYDEAGRLYDEILKADPTNKIAYYNAATLHEKYTKDYKQALKYLEEYVSNNNDNGQIGPDHEVYERMERVKESQRIEDERKAEEARKKKEAEDRKKRQEEQFDLLKTKVAGMQADYDTYGTCEMMIEMGGAEMMEMVLEQANMVIEAEEVDMAGDIMMFVDDLQPQIDALKAECSDGGAAPAPEVAPEEGGEETPAEEAPAEEAPAEGGE